MNLKIEKYVKENKEKIFAIIFTVIYAIITVIIALHHENWRDENQVWLLCKNLSFIDLIKQLKYEGHPIMWFAIVYPFVKIGLSCKILNILSWIMMVISVYLILKKAPLGKIAKLCIIVTFPFMYQYVIIARSYSLIVLLVTIICVLDKEKKQHPILYGIVLGLLANTHIMMVGLVGIITITFYIYELIINRKNNTKEENEKILKGFIIVVASGVLLILQLIGCLIGETGVKTETSIIELFRAIPNIILQFGNSLLNSSEYENVVNLIFFVFILMGVFKYRKETIIFLCAILFQCLLYAVIGTIESYMLMSIILILMYSMWSASNRIIKENGNKEIIIMFEVMLIIISLLSLQSIKTVSMRDYEFNFSSSREIGTYINENLNDSIFITARDAECSSIIAYTENAKFWNINTQKYFTYITWGAEREDIILEENIDKVIKNNFSNNKDVYYITCSRRDDIVEDYLLENGQLEEIYRTDDTIMDESYIIYKFNM